jgi:hypothetical protein
VLEIAEAARSASGFRRGFHRSILRLLANSKINICEQRPMAPPYFRGQAAADVELTSGYAAASSISGDRIVATTTV